MYYQRFEWEYIVIMFNVILKQVANDIMKLKWEIPEGLNYE